MEGLDGVHTGDGVATDDVGEDAAAPEVGGAQFAKAGDAGGGALGVVFVTAGV